MAAKQIQYPNINNNFDIDRNINSLDVHERQMALLFEFWQLAVAILPSRIPKCSFADV